jgi:hypothetical protein
MSRGAAPDVPRWFRRPGAAGDLPRRNIGVRRATGAPGLGRAVSTEFSAFTRTRCGALFLEPFRGEGSTYEGRTETGLARSDVPHRNDKTRGSLTMRTWMAAAGVAMGMVLGCVGPNGINSTGGGASGQGGSGAGAGTGGSTGTGTTTTTIGGDSGLPCDVATLLSAQCTSCHGSPVSGGAPMSLLTYAELTAPSKTDATKSNAQLSVERMNSASAPMPPGVHLPAADIAVMASWVSAGTPMGTCGMVDAGPPDTTFDGPSTCVGNVQSPICSESKSMNPGMPCLDCHNNPGKYSPPCNGGSEGGPGFDVAGTLFKLGHVPDNCHPSSAVTADLTAAKVIITDANGVEHSLSVNSAGNFYSGNTNIAFPYNARVEWNGKVRAMSAKQTNGDCNVCHTDAGTQMAPGRIALPQ